MPLYPSSFFVPASASIPFLLEDKYMRGGWHCVADEAERDAIGTGARKLGMRVYVADTGETWTLENSDINTWVQVPDSATRATLQHTPVSAIAVSGTSDFTLATGKSAFVLKCESTHADLTIECHATPSRNDSNPYKFVSYAGHLIDDGSSVLEDATTQYNRRFAIISNLEATPGINSYWRITNDGSGSVTPTISITYLTLEQ